MRKTGGGSEGVGSPSRSPLLLVVYPVKVSAIGGVCYRAVLYSVLVGLELKWRRRSGDYGKR